MPATHPNSSIFGFQQGTAELTSGAPFGMAMSFQSHVVAIFADNSAGVLGGHSGIDYPMTPSHTSGRVQSQYTVKQRGMRMDVAP